MKERDDAGGLASSASLFLQEETISSLSSFVIDCRASIEYNVFD